MTTRAGVLLIALTPDAPKTVPPAIGVEVPSCRGPTFRAESAANGDTGFGREAPTASVRRVSPTAPEDEATIEGRAAVRAAPAPPPGKFELEPEAPATSLSNCSIGNKCCACAIFKSPSSR